MRVSVFVCLRWVRTLVNVLSPCNLISWLECRVLCGLCWRFDRYIGIGDGALKIIWVIWLDASRIRTEGCLSNGGVVSDLHCKDSLAASLAIASDATTNYADGGLV